VRSTVDHVAHTFREHDRYYLRYNAGQKLTFILQQQYKPDGLCHQTARPPAPVPTTNGHPSVECWCITANTARCRGPSGQSSYVPGMFDSSEVAMKLPQDRPKLSLPVTAPITCEDQKCYQRNFIITQHRTGDPLLCPVRVWEKVIQ
jgi:hypothetical protein